MQPENTKVRKIEDRNCTVWLFAMLLAVLVMATVAIVGTCFYNYSRRSDCVISLSEGSSEKTAKSSQTIYTGSQAKKVVKEQSFMVEDPERVWSTSTAVELFDVSYQNDAGQVTVRSENSDKVIAPGTDGKYTFTLKNTSKKSADYKVWIETTINTQLTGIPFEMRMSGGDGWLLGDKNSWEMAENLDGVSVTEQVEPGNSKDYTIYWKWPFEQENDEADTRMADVSVGQELNYTVTIHTIATESNAQAGGDSSSTGDGGLNSVIKAVKTGDFVPVAGILIALITSGFIVVYLLKRQKEEKR